MRGLKLWVLRTLEASGANAWLAQSDWRRQRLLILCWHGVSLEDEHEWSPGLFLSPAVFRRRLEQIAAGGYRVLPLGEAVRRLGEGSLPEKAVAITFDDGLYDFRARAWPELERHGFPATVYQTTYYTEFNRPVFRLICSYMMWKRRGQRFAENGWDGRELDLTAPESWWRETAKLDEYSKKAGLSGREKDEVAGRLAERLGFDWEKVVESRILRLMTEADIGELAALGVDFQLHTHKHRTPRREEGLREELEENRKRLERYTGRKAAHLCYPSGIHHAEYPEWLRRWGADSAVTCHSGLAGAGDDRMLLPRLVDMMLVKDEEFGAWLSGWAALLPRRRHDAVEPDPD